MQFCSAWNSHMPLSVWSAMILSHHQLAETNSGIQVILHASHFPIFSTFHAQIYFNTFSYTGTAECLIQSWSLHISVTHFCSSMLLAYNVVQNDFLSICIVQCFATHLGWRRLVPFDAQMGYSELLLALLNILLLSCIPRCQYILFFANTESFMESL